MCLAFAGSTSDSLQHFNIDGVVAVGGFFAFLFILTIAIVSEAAKRAQTTNVQGIIELAKTLSGEDLER